MTQARTHANEVGSPSLPQLLLDALLRLFVELVQNVVATLWMRRSDQTCDWHTDPIVNALPGETTDPTKDPHAVQPDSPIALMVSSTRSVRPSNHEGVLTNRATPTASFSGLVRESRLAQPRDRQFLAPLIPMKIGTLSNIGTRAKTRHTRTPLWIPAFAGTSGDRSARESART